MEKPMDCHIERCHDRVGGGMFVLDESGKDPILVIESKVDGHKLFLLVHYLFFFCGNIFVNKNPSS
jgi:hypothetical protein